MWDKIKAPFLTFIAAVTSMTLLFGIFISIKSWNDAAAATKILTLTVDTLRKEVRIKQHDPRIDTVIRTLPVIIEVVNETRLDVHNIKTELSSHLAKSMSADEWRKLMNEFFKPVQSDTITWYYKKLR